MYELKILENLGPLPCGTKGTKENHSRVECGRCHAQYTIRTTSAKKNKSGTCKTCSQQSNSLNMLTDSDFPEAVRKSGVYLLYKDDVIVYVGKSTTSVASRLSRHTLNQSKDFDKAVVYLMHNLSNVNVIEPYLIEMYKPVLNTHCKSEDICTLQVANLNDVIDTQIEYIINT